MPPFKSLIQIDKQAKMPIYQQITHQFIGLIQSGVLKHGQIVLSSRKMSELLGVHRKTIVLAYDELIGQGWLETKQGSGTYIAENLPNISPQKLKENSANALKQAGFKFEKSEVLLHQAHRAKEGLHLDDGFPDPRLAPLLELSRAYRSQLMQGNLYVRLGYGDTKGSEWLRNELAQYLNESRGLKVTPDNILICRGTMMCLFLTIRGLINVGDNVIMSQNQWLSARINFTQAGANILTVGVDENGLNVDEIEALCQQQSIRLVYVTSHHNYPTTVTLKADRRIKLLHLAQQHRFIVFEDDYDYDFHYQSRPLLPLASADETGNVLYSGSFTKSISPAFRVGYLVASEDVIEYLGYHRRIIDRQGDTMLENAVAELLHTGIIQKHLRKSLREYRERRDFFCNLLHQQLSNEIQFQLPEGGMSVWAQFERSIDLVKTAEKSLKNGLYFSNGTQYGATNATRLGFASSNIGELQRAIEVLQRSIVTK